MGNAGIPKAQFKKYLPKLGTKTEQVFNAISQIGPCHLNQIKRHLNNLELVKSAGSRRRWKLKEINNSLDELLGRFEKIEFRGEFVGRYDGRKATCDFWSKVGENRPVPSKWGMANIKSSHEE